jgi:hypothetical protein
MSSTESSDAPPSGKTIPTAIAMPKMTGPARKFAGRGGAPSAPFGRRYHHMTSAATAMTLLERHAISMTS